MTPVIVVYGLPSAPNLRELQDKLITAITEIRDLNIPTSQIFTFFPADLISEGLGEELIASVDGVDNLLPKTSGDIIVIDKLVKTITAILSEYAKNNLPQCNFVKTFIRPYSTTQYKVLY